MEEAGKETEERPGKTTTHMHHTRTTHAAPCNATQHFPLFSLSLHLFLRFGQYLIGYEVRVCFDVIVHSVSPCPPLNESLYGPRVVALLWWENKGRNGAARGGTRGGRRRRGRRRGRRSCVGENLSAQHTLSSPFERRQWTRNLLIKHLNTTIHL